MTTARDLFQSGKLAEAISMATEGVRKQPSDYEARGLLAELLCFAGDLERADKQLDATAQFAPATAWGVAMLRHLLRAETSRREVFLSGRVPEFIDVPTESQQLRLRALMCLRERQVAEAADVIAQACELEEESVFEVNGNVISGFRDLDDMLGPNLEVYTATGSYYWIGTNSLMTLEFVAPDCLTDLLWRPASIETTGKLAGRVHLPSLYFGSHEAEDHLARVGRSTDWKSMLDGRLVTGIGQREYLAGEEQIPIMEIKSIRRPEG